jgi:hypothetical protein
MHMKKTMTALAVLALAGAGWAPLTLAADISHATQVLDLSQGTASFARTIDAGNAGNTFADRYDFTLTGTSSLLGLLSGFNGTDFGGVTFNNFSLVNSAGLSLDGTKVLDQNGVQTWRLAARPLVADTYHLLVSGSVLNAKATSYVGAVAVSAVPEPQTYALLAGGLGLLGYVARRRKT